MLRPKAPARTLQVRKMPLLRVTDAAIPFPGRGLPGRSLRRAPRGVPGLADRQPAERDEPGERRSDNLELDENAAPLATLAAAPHAYGARRWTSACIVSRNVHSVTTSGERETEAIGHRCGLWVVSGTACVCFNRGDHHRSLASNSPLTVKIGRW